METPQPARSVLSLLGLLALAAVLGVATAFALGAIAMLLAAPAYAAENEEPGCLMLRGAGGANPAPLLSTEVVFRVAGPVARVRVVQTFRNPLRVADAERITPPLVRPRTRRRFT